MYVYVCKYVYVYNMLICHEKKTTSENKKGGHEKDETADIE